MGFFTKKELRPEAKYKVFVNAKSRALNDAMDKKHRLGPRNLKRSIAEYMDEHENDKFDSRRLGRTFKFKAIE